MWTLLHHGFGLVCGQNPGHTWALGGLELPCCQRCTGLYAGACSATLLHLWLRPKCTGRFLEVHGAFLLLMTPFGFHWLPQGPTVRALTGVLFGFGLVAFLALSIVARGQSSQESPPPGPLPIGWRAGATPVGRLLVNPIPWPWGYALGLALALVLVPWSAAQGGPWAAFTLSGLALGGALALGVLVLANTLLALRGALHLVRRLLQACPLLRNQ
ncbi:MAG TPA: DUF2085 domain-containing protein, partial [Candidatus Sulfotelmatobacter sp.]|nr:DUF2085 domain-containing protein [Candidatus Sulfotelmatobacter sp.]